jgi:hypothetical protein
MDHGSVNPVFENARPRDALPESDGRKGWNYLNSDAFTTRYVLAAHFVRECRAVVEIGGSVPSIDDFLTGIHDSVLVIDPRIEESDSDMLRGKRCRVAHVRARFQDVDWQVLAGIDYGLVMLGLYLDGLEPCHYEMLYRLINQARVTVIEFPPSWEPSRRQFEMIRANTRTRVTFQVLLDLTYNDLGNLENSWPPRCDRAIHVLQPR